MGVTDEKPLIRPDYKKDLYHVLQMKIDVIKSKKRDGKPRIKYLI